MKSSKSTVISQVAGRFLLFSPLVVLLLTRLGVEVSTHYFHAEVSWIPAFIGYYMSIVVVYLIIRYVFKVDLPGSLGIGWQPLPKPGLLIATIVLPALLPIGAFLTQKQFVPSMYFVYILVFALINAPFEEFYWRGILSFLPGSNLFRTIFTAGLFSFSHYFFWDYWYDSVIILIPTIVSTFIMGVLWMHFMNKRKNLLYPIVSHIVVDVLNLSVAVYSGLIDPPSF